MLSYTIDINSKYAWLIHLKDIYFDSFGVKHIPKEIQGNKNIITNSCRIQPYDLIMCGILFYWIY